MNEDEYANLHVQEYSLDANTAVKSVASTVLGIISIILGFIPLVFLIIFGGDGGGAFFVVLFLGPLALVALILSIIGLNLRRGTTTGKKRCRIGLYLGLIMPLWLLLFIFLGHFLA